MAPGCVNPPSTEQLIAAGLRGDRLIAAMLVEGIAKSEEDARFIIGVTVSGGCEGVSGR